MWSHKQDHFSVQLGRFRRPCRPEDHDAKQRTTEATHEARPARWVASRGTISGCGCYLGGATRMASAAHEEGIAFEMGARRSRAGYVVTLNVDTRVRL